MQHAETAFGEPAHEVEHHPRLRDAERGGRFVHDHEPRVPEHRLGDRHRLALAARQRRHRLAHRPHRRHAPDDASVSPAARLHRLLVEQPEPGALAAEEHVLDDVEVVGAARGPGTRSRCRGPAALAGCGCAAVCPSHRISPPSGAWMPETVRMSTDLPAPLSPTERGDLPGGHLEVHAAQRPHRAEALLEARSSSSGADPAGAGSATASVAVIGSRPPCRRSPASRCTGPRRRRTCP